MIALAHGRVHRRRIRVLARHLSELLPARARVLDVGCGNGSLAVRVMTLRADIEIVGVDVLSREESLIPVQLFDGRHLSFETNAFDAVMMIDVLHHAADQEALLTEAARVARDALIIKDHIMAGSITRATLAFMDWVGNARHGVSLPYAYWTAEQWEREFTARSLRVVEFRPKLGLYPWPASLMFERRLHFIAKLEHAVRVSSGG